MPAAYRDRLHSYSILIIFLKGRRIESVQTRACAKDNVLTVANASASLQADASGTCRLHVQGCVHVARAVASTTIALVLKKGPLQVYRGDAVDACDLAKKMPGADLVAGANGDCSHQPGVVCTSEEARAGVDVTEYASLLEVARGRWSAIARLTHDSGSSCVRLNVHIA